MREVFQAINDYPWTTFFVFVMLIIIIDEVGDAIKKRK